MAIDWRNFIASSPDVLCGKPRFKGTRIPVSLILGYLAEGRSVDEIIERLLSFLRDQSDDFFYHGKLLLVQPHRIRIRAR